jgi:signal transduction histidine kinase
VGGEQDRYGVDRATSGLLDAVLLISSDLDLHGALDRLVRASCQLTGARYGFLGLLDDDGVIADFVLHGLDADQIAAIRQLPTGKGILGVLIEEPLPLRLADLAAHPRSVGFPVNHPQMHSFLGVPVRVEGKVYGNLYLTEKEGGEPFTGQDELLLEVLAQVAGFVIANARTHAASERRRHWLEAGIAMSASLEAVDDVGQALVEVAVRLREVADAVLVAVVEPSALRPATRLEGRTAVVVPMDSRLAAGHSLLVVLDDARLGVEGPDLDLFATYADQASLALDRTQALADRQEHMLVADRDRIARDLHDTVIQRIFATALQLQGLRREVPLEEVKGRLDEAVGELNTTIRDIRSTIFELRRDDTSSLKAEVRALAKEYVPVLGFTPFVRLRGALEGRVSAEIAEHLIATLREALSNVARHADADACVVEVEVTDESLRLRVSDNGRGPADIQDESGLRNVRRRAGELGGRFTLAPEDPHGTVLEWTVPLS